MDTVPDSTIESSEDLTSDSDEPRPCTLEHQHHGKPALYLPPSEAKAFDDKKGADLVTALMELQVAEDMAAKAIHKILTISPSSAPQMEKRINGQGIKDRLDSIGSRCKYSDKYDASINVHCNLIFFMN